MKTNQLQYVYNNKNYACSCYVSKANMMQYRYDICLSKKLLTENGKIIVEEKEYNPIFKERFIHQSHNSQI